MIDRTDSIAGSSRHSRSVPGGQRAAGGRGSFLGVSDEGNSRPSHSLVTSLP